MLEFLILFAVYSCVGLTVEVVYTASYGFLKSFGKDVGMRGQSYLWMVLVYGTALPYLYHPIAEHFLAASTPFLVRFIFWGLFFTTFEAIYGMLFDRFLGFCPWDYSKSKWKVFPKGYTKWSLIPAWGVLGLLLEPLAFMLNQLMPEMLDLLVETYPWFFG